MRNFLVLCLILPTLPSLLHAQQRLSLEEAIDLALTNNYSVRLVEGQAEIAARNLSYAWGAFLPQITLSANQSNVVADSRQQFLNADPQERSGATSHSVNAGLLVNWRIFDGLGSFATYDRIRELRDQGELVADIEAENTIAAVIRAYYDVARQQQQLEVLRNAVELSEERVMIAQLNHEVGTGSELEVRQARVDLNTDRSARLQQEASLSNAVRHLSRLLVLPGDPEIQVYDEIDVDRTLSNEELEDAVLVRNPDIQVAERELRVAEIERREVSAQRLPTINLSAGYEFSRMQSEFGFMQSSRNLDLRYGINASVNLFTGFDLRRRTEVAQIRIRNAELAISDIRLQVLTDLRQAFAVYHNSIERVDLQEENVEYARLNVEVALERYELGTISAIELREIQNALVDVESRLINAEYEAKSAEVDIRRLTGALQLLDSR